jgi:HK97 family phage major capsid protein
MFGTPTASGLADLKHKRSQLVACAESYLLAARQQGRETLSDLETRKFREMNDDIGALDQRIEAYAHDLERVGNLPAGLGGGGGGMGAEAYTQNWARQTLRSLKQALGGTEQRAIISGSVDVPILIEPEVVATPFKKRLIDAYGQKRTTPSTAIEYFQQTARTNNAAPTPDLAQKPTSVLTVRPVTDTCKVIATLSENLPLRIWTDEQAIVSWLTTQLAGAVVDAIETQTISGDGVGENFTGILNTPGINSVAFDTDPSTTLRKGLTALQNLGEVANGWCLHPSDAELFDLERWTSAGGFLHGGYENSGATVGTSDNILGAGLTRIVSPNVPAGVAIVADWTQLALYYRESMRIDVDGSGPLFEINAVRFRAESRCVSAVLRPQAFAVCDLSATTTRAKSSSSK